MADMPRKVKDVIVMILSFNGIELKYLNPRKREAVVSVNVRFTYKDSSPRRKSRRINAAKVVTVDMTKMAREASKLMSYDTGSERLDYIQYVGKVLSKFVSETKARERERLTNAYDMGQPLPATPTKLETSNEKVH